jgi:hypothetical protein
MGEQTKQLFAKMKPGGGQKFLKLKKPNDCSVIKKKNFARMKTGPIIKQQVITIELVDGFVNINNDFCRISSVSST